MGISKCSMYLLKVLALLGSCCSNCRCCNPEYLTGNNSSRNCCTATRTTSRTILTANNSSQNRFSEKNNKHWMQNYLRLLEVLKLCRLTARLHRVTLAQDTHHLPKTLKLSDHPNFCSTWGQSPYQVHCAQNARHGWQTACGYSFKQLLPLHQK